MAYGEFLWKRKRYKDAAKHFESAGGNYDFSGRSPACIGTAAAWRSWAILRRPRAPFSMRSMWAGIWRAHMELADLAFRQRDYINAEQHYEQFTKFAKQNPRSLWLGIRLHRVLATTIRS